MVHKFDPANWRRLESPERRAALPPETILQRIGLQPGDVFVDVGAGSGYFALPAARIVGERGRVYAVDVARPMLDVIEGRLRGQGLPVELVLSEELAIPLKSGIAEHVFTSTVLHEIARPDRIAFLTELARLLKPDGRLTVLDWAPVADRRMGPPSHIRIPQQDAVQLFEEADLPVVRAEPFGDEFYIVQGTRDRVGNSTAAE